MLRKYGNNEWIVMMGPGRFRDSCGFLLGRNFTGVSPALMQLCREIHAMLTAAPGITRIRWYFEGARTQGVAVNTPDELPWGQE